MWGVIGSGPCAGWGLRCCICTSDVKEATVGEGGELCFLLGMLRRLLFCKLGIWFAG